MFIKPTVTYQFELFKYSIVATRNISGRICNPKRPRYLYSGCHRFASSALNIILGKFNDNQPYLAVHKSELFGRVQPPDPIMSTQSRIDNIWSQCFTVKLLYKWKQKLPKLLLLLLNEFLLKKTISTRQIQLIIFCKFSLIGGSKWS